MRGFVLKLVEQLVADGQPLSRNRHFDTFDHPAGRRALKVSRQLRSLEREILASQRAGEQPVVRREEREGGVVIRLEFARLKASHVAYLTSDEFEILLSRPGVREALGE
jgi:hypothetical protein